MCFLRQSLEKSEWLREWDSESVHVGTDAKQRDGR